jgi:hypothetical protein
MISRRTRYVKEERANRRDISSKQLLTEKAVVTCKVIKRDSSFLV